MMIDTKDMSMECVCKRSLTSDGTCPACSLEPNNCACDGDVGSSDNASDLQALAGGSGEMGSSPPPPGDSTRSEE